MEITITNNRGYKIGNIEIGDAFEVDINYDSDIEIGSRYLDCHATFMGKTEVFEIDFCEEGREDDYILTSDEMFAHGDTFEDIQAYIHRKFFDELGIEQMILDWVFGLSDYITYKRKRNIKIILNY